MCGNCVRQVTEGIINGATVKGFGNDGSEKDWGLYLIASDKSVDDNERSWSEDEMVELLKSVIRNIENRKNRGPEGLLELLRKHFPNAEIVEARSMEEFRSMLEETEDTIDVDEAIRRIHGERKDDE